MFYFWYWKKTETKSFHFKPFLANKIRTKQNIYFFFPPTVSETFVPLEKISKGKKATERQKSSSFLPELMEISLEEMCPIS